MRIISEDPRGRPALTDGPKLGFRAKETSQRKGLLKREQIFKFESVFRGQIQQKISSNETLLKDANFKS